MQTLGLRFSTLLTEGGAHSPWAEDPYDAVVSFTALLVPLVAGLTFVRCQRWRGPAPMSTSAVRQVLRGVGVVLVAIGATVVADLAALLVRARVETWGPWFGSLVGLLALTGVLTLGAAALLALAWWRSRRYLAGEAANPAREDDALDDVLALSVEVGTSAGRRFPHLGEALITGARRADVALRSSRLSPRRHPWAFCFVVALLCGAAFSTQHSLLEGLPIDPALALRVCLLYAGILAMGIVAGPTFCSRCTTSWSSNARRRMQEESQSGSRRRWARPWRRYWEESLVGRSLQRSAMARAGVSAWSWRTLKVRMGTVSYVRFPNTSDLTNRSSARTLLAHRTVAISSQGAVGIVG